jgi:hypothetical protein
MVSSMEPRRSGEARCSLFSHEHEFHALSPLQLPPSSASSACFGVRLLLGPLQLFRASHRIGIDGHLVGLLQSDTRIGQ